MGHQMIRLLLLCICLAVAQAQAQTQMDTLFVDDSDGLQQYRVLVGVDGELDQPLPGGSAGFRVGHWRISDRAGSEVFAALKLHYDSGDERPWRTRLGAMQLSGEGSPTLGDVLVSRSEGPWYIEGSVQRELIDTVTAVRLHYLVDTYSVSADYRFDAHWTAVGALYAQSITDGNRRRGRVARLIYSPGAVEGLHLEARLRHAGSDFDGIGYFSPDRQVEYLLEAGYRRSLFGENWVAGGRLGIGRQQINRDIDNPLYQSEATLRGWFTDQLGLDGRLFCTTAGGNALGQGESGYRYCAAELSLIGAW